MSNLIYRREKVFSKDDRSNKLSLEFTHPGMLIRDLQDTMIILEGATLIQYGPFGYENPEFRNIRIYVKMIDNVIPFNKIDNIVEYLKKYNMTFHSILLRNRDDDLDLTNLKNTPRILSTRSCHFVNLKCSELEEIHVEEFKPLRDLPPINISLECCKNLHKLHISGKYTLSTNTLSKFEYLTKLDTLMLNSYLHDMLSSNRNLPLPYLGNCTHLEKLNMTSINIPEMFNINSNIRNSVDAKQIVKLCRSLRSDPHNRLMDICLALQSLRLPSYIILKIVNWLPCSDWISTNIKTLYRMDKSYTSNNNHCKKIPKWIMSDDYKIKLIRNINENKRNT